jgi:hypothetical protein
MTRRVQVLFLLALVGVLVCLGLVVGGLAGPWAAAAYAVVALGLLVVGSARARAAQAAAGAVATSEAGRTCTCCTASQHDPVEVV